MYIPGSEDVRPPVSPARGTEDGAEREAVPPAGAGGDPHPRAPQETGQGQHDEHRPHARTLHLQEPHLHHLRTAQHESVRTYQEEQIPGI